MSTSPQPLPSELLNRLIIGRELLHSFGSKLTPQSDALIVARAILTAQDSAELIASAIAQYVDGKRKSDMGLMQYIDSIESTGSTFPGKVFFDHVNKARVSFKHHGLLTNVQEFHDVLWRAEEHLDQACSVYLGKTLWDLDTSSMIANDEARRLYIDARDLAAQTKYREALETLAGALQAAVDDTPLQYRIIVGEAKSEIARLNLPLTGLIPARSYECSSFYQSSGLTANHNGIHACTGILATGEKTV